jgi:hypothetical protein
MSALWANIPAELRERNNWLLWRSQVLDSGKKTKIPYQCNGYPASVTNPSHWASFACAVECSGAYDGIGFAFGADDPYCGIDIDNANKHENPEWQLKRQLQVFERFQSYTERSPSGEGCHIIIKADIGKGVRDGALEIYSQERYLTFTGDVIRDLPIAEYQELALALKGDLRPDDTELIAYNEPEQERSDDDVLASCRNASNAALFHDLWAGSDSHHQGDTSRGDLALMNMIAYHSRNREQSVRLFMQSKRGERDKVHNHKRYVRSFDETRPGLIEKAFVALPEPYDISKVDFSSMFEKAVTLTQTAPEADGDTPEAVSVEPLPAPLVQQQDSCVDRIDAIGKAFKYVPPPGLLGRVAQFIYEQAPQQIPEIAIGGAFGFMAGICGQAYNVSDKGLNIYLMVLAGTGVGKESMATGIDRLMSAVIMKVPAATAFQGPGEFASPSAMIKQIATTPCCLSVGGEFGLRLRQLCDPNAKSNEIGIRRAFLDLYSKSGKYGIVKPLVYSDRATNTPTIHQPAFSFLGESTPMRFYDAIEAEMVAEGLIPRFSFIEYAGPVPPFNDTHGKVQPSPQLIDDAASLAAYALTIIHSQAPIDVAYTPDALTLLTQFREYARYQNNNSEFEITKEMYSRAHMKVLKIAALIAVGTDYLNPTITTTIAEYAIGFVLTETNLLIERFQKGEVGKLKTSTLETKRIEEVVKAIALFAFSKFGAYKVVGATEDEHKQGLVRKSAIQTKVSPLKPFHSAMPNTAMAVQQTLATLCEWGWLDEVELASTGRGKKPVLYKIREEEPFLAAFVRLEAKGKVREVGQ